MTYVLGYGNSDKHTVELTEYSSNAQSLEYWSCDE